MKLKQMTPIQVPRNRHSVALIDNNLIYIAGGESSKNVLASVEEYVSKKIKESFRIVIIH